MCTHEIGYLQSINSLCVGLKELTLITFWNKLFGYGSIVVCTTLNSLWLGSKPSQTFQEIVAFYCIAHCPLSVTNFCPDFLLVLQ
jgi:hypothetical protein